MRKAKRMTTPPTSLRRDTEPFASSGQTRGYSFRLVVLVAVPWRSASHTEDARIEAQNPPGASPEAGDSTPVPMPEVAPVLLRFGTRIGSSQHDEHEGEPKREEHQR